MATLTAAVESLLHHKRCLEAETEELQAVDPPTPEQRHRLSVVTEGLNTTLSYLRDVPARIAVLKAGAIHEKDFLTAVQAQSLWNKVQEAVGRDSSQADAPPPAPLPMSYLNQVFTSQLLDFSSSIDFSADVTDGVAPSLASSTTSNGHLTDGLHYRDHTQVDIALGDRAMNDQPDFAHGCTSPFDSLDEKSGNEGQGRTFADVLAALISNGAQRVAPPSSPRLSAPDRDGEAASAKGQNAALPGRELPPDVPANVKDNLFFLDETINKLQSAPIASNDAVLNLSALTSPSALRHFTQLQTAGYEDRQVYDLSAMPPAFAVTLLKPRALKIGTWERIANDSGDIEFRILFAKRMFHIEVRDFFTKVRQRMSFSFADVAFIMVRTLADGRAELTLGLNDWPVFTREQATAKDNNPKFVKAEQDWTPDCQATTVPQFVMILPKYVFTARYGTISHYEKMMIGDPWLRSVPSVGVGIALRMTPSYEDLRMQTGMFLTHVFSAAEKHGEEAMAGAFNACLDHKFKISSYVTQKEGVKRVHDAFAINFDEIVPFVDPLYPASIPRISKEHLMYFALHTKIAELGCAVFRPPELKDSRPSSDAAGREEANETITDTSIDDKRTSALSMELSDESADDEKRRVSGTRKRRAVSTRAARSAKKARVTPPTKSRFAVIFSRVRCRRLFGPDLPFTQSNFPDGAQLTYFTDEK